MVGDNLRSLNNQISKPLDQIYNIFVVSMHGELLNKFVDKWI